eukprot:m.11893 g.11893  ORF g.11893 m.11893 type:complete len:1257 (+) comp23675_c0_seq1:47-3817(+)
MSCACAFSLWSMASSKSKETTVRLFQEMFGASLGLDVVRQVMEENFYDTDRSVQALLAMQNERESSLKRERDRQMEMKLFGSARDRPHPVGSAMERETAPETRSRFKPSAQLFSHLQPSQRPIYPASGDGSVPQRGQLMTSGDSGRTVERPWESVRRREESMGQGGFRNQQSMWGHPGHGGIPSAQHQARDEPERVLIILRGLPGSGKSTLARQLQGARGVICSTDDYFVLGNGKYVFDVTRLGDAHDWNQDKARQAMRRGEHPVIIDNTNCQRWEMKPYVLAARKCFYKVNLVEPDTPWKFDVQELARRNTHGVPAEKIATMLDRYECNVSVDSILSQSHQSSFLRSGAFLNSPRYSKGRGLFVGSVPAQERSHRPGADTRYQLNQGTRYGEQRMPLENVGKWAEDDQREKSLAVEKAKSKGIHLLSSDASTSVEDVIPRSSLEQEPLERTSTVGKPDTTESLHEQNLGLQKETKVAESGTIEPMHSAEKPELSTSGNDQQKVSTFEPSQNQRIGTFLASLSSSLSVHESSPGAVSTEEFLQLLRHNMDDTAADLSPPSKQETEEEDEHRQFNQLVQDTLESQSQSQSPHSAQLPPHSQMEDLKLVSPSFSHTFASQNQRVADAIEFLKSCFPNMEEELLAKELCNNQYNVEATVDVLVILQPSEFDNTDDYPDEGMISDDDEDEDEDGDDDEDEGHSSPQQFQQQQPQNIGDGGSSELHGVVTDELDAVIAHSLDIEEELAGLKPDGDLQEGLGKKQLQSDEDLAKQLQDQYDKEASSKSESQQPHDVKEQKSLSSPMAPLDESVSTVATESLESHKGETDEVSLVLDKEFAAQLQRLFGSVPYVECQEDYVVHLNAKFAKKLHRKWMSDLEVKYEPQATEQRRLLQQDEEFARRLQEEENKSLAGEGKKKSSKFRKKKEARQHQLPSLMSPPQSSTTGHGSSYKQPFLDIMGEQMAEASKGQSKFKIDKEMEYATKSKRRHLYDMFPSLPQADINQIFAANDYALQQTIDCIKNSGVEPKLVSSHFLRKSPRPEQDEDDVDGAVGYYQTADEPGYEDYRAEASVHAKQREECFRKAAKAFHQKQGQLAQWYSQQAKLHTQRMEEANKRAYVRILDSNRGKESKRQLDLHGLHVKEAIEALEDALAKWRLRGQSSGTIALHLCCPIFFQVRNLCSLLLSQGKGCTVKVGRPKSNLLWKVIYVNIELSMLLVTVLVISQCTLSFSSLSFCNSTKLLNVTFVENYFCVSKCCTVLV